MTGNLSEIDEAASSRVYHEPERVAGGLPVVIAPEDLSWERDALLIPKLDADEPLGAVVTFIPTVSQADLELLDLDELHTSEFEVEGLEPLAITEEEAALLETGELMPGAPETEYEDEISQAVGSIAVASITDGKITEADGTVYRVLQPPGLSGLAKAETRGSRQEAVFDALIATHVQVTGVRKFTPPRIQHLVSSSGAEFEIVNGVPTRRIPGGQ